MLSNSPVQPHINAAMVITSALLNIPVPLEDNTTINQMLGILPEATPTANERLSFGYIGFSNTGTYQETIKGVNVLLDIPNTFTDTGMYSLLPLVGRELTDDLTAEERAKFRMRRVEATDVGQRVFYYLRKVDVSNAVVRRVSRSIVNSVKSSPAPIVHSVGDLYPVPKSPALLVEAAKATTSEYAGTTAVVEIVFSPEEIVEIVNACDLKYGDPATALLTKMGLFVGCDRAIQGTEDGSGVSRVEAIQTMLITTMAMDEKLMHYDAELTIPIDMGITEPLYRFNSNG